MIFRRIEKSWLPSWRQALIVLVPLALIPLAVHSKVSAWVAQMLVLLTKSEYFRTNSCSIMYRRMSLISDWSTVVCVLFTNDVTNTVQYNV